MKTDIIIPHPEFLSVQECRHLLTLNPRGVFINITEDTHAFSDAGMEHDFLWWQKRLYLFKANPEMCPTFIHPRGYMLQPNFRFKTDHCSVPRIFRRYVERDAYLWSGLFHDSAYKHGVRYICHFGAKRFEPQTAQKMWVDDDFQITLLAEGARPLTAYGMFLSVEYGARGIWNDYRKGLRS